MYLQCSFLLNSITIKSLIFSFFLFTFSFTSAQNLQLYLQEAEAKNPDIQAYELRYNIAREKINEVNTLPNTIIGAGYFVSEPETRTGTQRARFSISQMLPWFGTITARENYASAMAEAEFTEIVIAKRKLSLAVAQSYYELFANIAEQKVLAKNINLLKAYEQLALTAVETGSASAVDVLRLQIRQNELQQQKEVLHQQYLAEQAAFNHLLTRKKSVKVEVVSELRIPLEDSLNTTDSLSINPELLRYEQLYASIEQSELLNQKESAPDIGFGLDYLPVSERPNMIFNDNGKDILMPTVLLSIPIFNKSYRSISKQNELRRQEIEAQKMQRLHVLQTAFAKATSQRNQARIRFLTQEKNLKQAKDAEEILTKNYETGSIDFNDVLDIQELQLTFQVNQIEAVRLYYAQSAIINYLMN